METDIASEIETVRGRLAEIRGERDALPKDSFAERADLLDEEHELAARLAGLKDRAAAGYVRATQKEAARQTDLTRTPGLPETDSER